MQCVMIYSWAHVRFRWGQASCKSSDVHSLHISLGLLFNSRLVLVISFLFECVGLFRSYFFVTSTAREAGGVAVAWGRRVGDAADRDRENMIIFKCNFYRSNAQIIFTSSLYIYICNIAMVSVVNKLARVRVCMYNAVDHAHHHASKGLPTRGWDS